MVKSSEYFRFIESLRTCITASQKRVQNKKEKQNSCPEPRNHTKDPPIAPLFFGTVRLFLKILDCTKVSPLRFFRHFATQWMLKNPKGSPSYIFWHCGTVKKSHFNFFWKFFPKGLQFNFFSYFATSRDTAPTLAVLGLFMIQICSPSFETRMLFRENTAGIFSRHFSSKK